MVNTHQLKQYLIEGDNPFLLSNDNNKKTIMLSGAWGAGKTHFWQNEIEPDLQKKLKEQEKACVYVSLYGKTSLESIKQEILIKASSEKPLLSKEVSTFGIDALSSIKDSELLIGKIAQAADSLNKYRKSSKGTQKLEKGGIICFDDFERKSKEIDLNDLFGFISHLALTMECKVVIILNSDVFEGKDEEIFKNVKEKTVNKYFYFKPTIEELFESIYSSDQKYSALAEHKNAILDAIKETEELNARLYIQVLDNCLECYEKRTLNLSTIRVLVVATSNFILNHNVFEYMIPTDTRKHTIVSSRRQHITYKETNDYPRIIRESLIRITLKSDKNISTLREIEYLELIHFIDKELKRKNTNGNHDISTAEHDEVIKWLNNHENNLKALWKYGYQLYYVADVDEETYNEIAQFVESGILL